MKFFSVIGKRLADKANSNLTKKQTKQAQRNAYMATGRKIKQAKKNHKRIKGSSVYRSEFKKEMQKVEKRHSIFSFFIDLIFS